jgi:hypothetical protein
VLRVFFDGSLTEALADHFSDPQTCLDDAELQRMRALIEKAGILEPAAQRPMLRRKKS